MHGESDKFYTHIQKKKRTKKIGATGECRANGFNVVMNTTQRKVYIIIK